MRYSVLETTGNTRRNTSRFFVSLHFLTPTLLFLSYLLLYPQANDRTSASNSIPPMTAERLAKNIQSNRFNGEPYDFNFRETYFADIISFIGRVCGLRFAFSDAAVRARVTFQQVQIPWDEALHMFLDMQGMRLTLLTINGIEYLFVDCREKP